MRRQFSLVVYALIGCLLGRAADLAPTPLESLLTNPPFGQQPVESSSATSVIPLELRGVIVDSGEVFFSVFDFASRSSRWVGLNERGNPFTVRGYDKDKNEAKVDYQGRELTLVLKQATLIVLAPAPASAAKSAAAPSNNAGQTQATATSASTSDEAVRLAQIAEEISRRRALRAQAKLQSNPGQQPAASPK